MSNSNTQGFRIKRAALFLGLFALALAGAVFYFKSSGVEFIPDIKATPTSKVNVIGSPTNATDIYSIDVQLSEGSSQPRPTQAVSIPSAQSLSPQEIVGITSRLPALPIFGDQVAFKLPEETLPPPRPGNVIEESFPPTITEAPPAPVEAGVLKVLRYSPEGEVPIAPLISVTFNQPMIPIGTISDLKEVEVPVKIEPALEGTWRWLGDKTLTFDYDSKLMDRLPMATEYRVTIPAGTKSFIGGTLAESVSWTFKTPPPTMVASYPSYESQPLDPIMFIAFDQRIDQAAVLKNINVKAGGQLAEIELVSQTEVGKDEYVNQLAKSTPEGRWLAFRSTKPFPTDTQIVVTIEAGTPSAEGPLTTTSSQSFTFSTYAPLRIEEHRCAWDDRCPPLTPFYIRFNNPLDMDAFREELIRVEPAIPGMTINAYGDSIEISGATKGQTTYTVTVSGSLQDIFGQTLGEDEDLTFKVGKAEPILVGPGQNLVTLDPTSTRPVFSVYAINYSKLNLKVYSVQPEDWTKFREYLRDWQRTDSPPSMPGRLVADKSMNLDLPNDELTQVDIDLQPYMKGDYGHFVVIVEPPASVFENEEDKWRRFYQTVIAWVQVTQIGLDVYSDHSEMIAWTTDLKTGAPLSGVSVQADNGSANFKTDANGIARFDLPSGATFLVARKGSDQAILPRSANYWYDDAWVSNRPRDSLRWYVMDDRQMYRPSEEVHIKGWLRLIGGAQDADVNLLSGSQNSVNYRVVDPQGNEIGNGSAQVNALGGFDFVFTVPQNANLGYAQVYLSAGGDISGLDGREYVHQFQIQEFRRPEFETTARNETTGPYFVGDHATLAVDAKYYAGGGLPNADVTWSVTTTPGNYAPPNWNDFTFGSWTPWWIVFDEFSGDYYGYPENGPQPKTFTGKTDATGTHYLGLDFVQQGNPANQPRPQSVVAQATVMDVNRQAWSSTTTLLIHPADVYIGLRSDRYFVSRGEPLKIDFVVVDLDGNPIEGRPLTITAGRLEWKYKDGKWAEEEVDVQTCERTSTTEPDTCSFNTPLGGSYQITATVTDDMGRKNQSRFTRWVSGGKQPPARNVKQEEVTLIPDKETYQPGETAHILVQSPFSPAEGILTVTRNGILYTKRFQIEDGSVTLDIPIEEKFIPNLNIQVDLVGAAPRMDDSGEPLAGAPQRPAFASGQLNLKIPPLKRTLSLDVTPEESSLSPGSETSVTVTVKDANGNPVPNAELTVVVVDEAILALSDYQLADPLSVFYSDYPSLLSSIYGRASIILADPQSLSNETRTKAAADGMLGGGDFTDALEAPAAMALPASTMTAEGQMRSAPNEANAPIAMRANFNPLATFAPSARTGYDGSARVHFKLPDNLTRYRIMVVAVDSGGSQFGSGESNLTARLPLMVRPSAPRFLNFGDKFELTVVLQNQTDDPMTVDVVARASNLEITNEGQRVTVPANDRVEVRFPASTIMAGSARIQVAATSGGYFDAATVDLPVYTPATSEAFAVYGVIDEGAIAQPIQYPSGVFPQYGGLEIQTSSTALQTLTDAVLYLVEYPFECSEQLASRILGVASLRDVLTAFKAEGLPSPDEMESAVERDIKRLQGLQNYDGGFPTWRQGFESIPFNTIHVAHALVRAEEKGFNVPQDMKQNALSYLRDIENHYPPYYSQQTRWTLSAYALYVRDLMGDRDSAKAESLLNEAGLENLSMEAIGWLWSVIDNETQLEAIRVYVNNHVVETAGAANFTTSYDDQSFLLLSSDRRTDAILLDALMEDNPQSDLIPKAVNGLLAHRSKGRWGNTQENVFVLVALDRYFNTYEAQTPDFVARIWLGDVYAGGNEFQGRTTDIFQTAIPMNYVLSETSAGTQNLILSKDGDGRLYYRIGLQYAPTDLNLKPLDMGFVVQRRYEAVDNPEDVYQDSNGVWHIKAGTRVRIKIAFVATNRRYHVALVDPLPAGLEIINPYLAVSQSAPPDPTVSRNDWVWWGPWFEHQNLRDDRAEAFTSLLWDGVYEYSYVARATTFGVFIVPPTKAEEMYSPEVFGRSGSDVVIVE